MSTLLIAIVAPLALILLVALFVLNRYKVAGPHEAYVITGRKGSPVTNPETGEVTTDLSGQKVVMGASVFVVPFVQRLAVLDLASQQINIHVGSAVSANGIRCALEGVAIVKVGGTEDSVRAAAQRFLGQQNEVSGFTTEVLAGSLRSIVGRLTVEEIIRDRAAFAREVAEEAESALTPQGLVLDSFQLQDIQAEGSYLADLGRPEAARAQMEARVAEAAANRESEQARLQAEEAVAEAQRTLALRTAEIKAETDAAQADADASGPKAQAAQDRDVLAAQQTVAEERARLKELELDTEIRKPADAARYATEQEAEAAKTAQIRAAEARQEATVAAARASAEESRLTGAGERQQREQLALAAQAEGVAAGEAERSRRAAIAEAVRLEGEAEASAISARGEAEAEAMSKKADAYERYGSAALTDLVVSKLPEIVRAGSEPLGSIDKMTVISTDGASSVTKSVTSNIAQLMEMASSVTGVDITELLSGVLSGAVAPTPPPYETSAIDADEREAATTV